MKPILIYNPDGDIIPIVTGGTGGGDTYTYNNPVPDNTEIPILTNPKNPTDYLPPVQQNNNSNGSLNQSSDNNSILILAALAFGLYILTK